MSFSLSDYEKVAVRFLGGKQPVSSKKRVSYRTFTESNGIKFVSKVHLGQYANYIDWSNNPHNKIYDFIVVETKNPLLSMAKTRKI